MSGFDILDRSLNVFAPLFLEASAGTGKTFAIEHLVCRLLIEGEEPLTIEQILVVTFTRAATRELKLRIRRNLARAREELLNGPSSFDYLIAITERGDATVKQAIERIDAALICYDAANIFTLHGFCYQILREFAFEAGVGMQVNDPDEKEHVPLLQHAVKDALRSHISFPSYSPYQIRSLLKKKGGHRKMVSSLVDTIQQGKEIGAMPAHDALLSAFLEEVRRLPEIDPAALKEEILLLATHYKGMTSPEIPLQVDQLVDILAAKECTPHAFDTLLKGELFLEKMGEENKKVRTKFPPASDLRYPGLIERLRRTLLPPLEAAKDPSRTFLRLARDLKAQIRPLLEKQEKFSPDNLLLKVEEALRLPRFIEHVRKKYKAAIIDEFQDTDPVQWNIFKELFLTKENAVCLVGDPKQSIYAFRNADLYVYFEAAKKLGKEAKKHLSTNFRSTAPLVDALNTLFGMAKGGWMDLPGRDVPLEVLPVQAGSKLEADPDETPIEVFVSADKLGKSRKFPTEATLSGKVFPYIASEIHRLRNDKGIALHEIAILIKDRYQGKELIDFLKTQGIPATAKRAGTLLDSPAYPVLKEVLAAALSPFDMGKLKTALGSPLIAWRAEDLARQTQDSVLLEARGKMQKLSETLYERGFSSFLHALFKTAWKKEEMPLLQELLGRGELSLYLDLRKLSELIIEEETLKGLKADALPAFLEELAADEHKEESRLKTPPEEEKGSVAIMTMHMSKGLEFDIVFSLGAASRHKRPEYISLKKEGIPEIAPFDPTDPACLKALEEIDAEKMRQFYVALTRARKKLYIPLTLDPDQKEVPLGEASPSELFFARIQEEPAGYEDLYHKAEALSPEAVAALFAPWKGKIACAMLQETVLSVSQPVATAKMEEVAPALPFTLPTSGETLLSFTSLSKSTHTGELIKPAEDAPLSPHTFPLGADTGILLHLLFEKIFKRRLHCPLDEEGIGALIEEEIAFSPLKAWRPIFLPWIVQLLQKQLVDFSLSAIPGNQLLQEMEFLFPVPGGAMKGFADLVFVFEGKYYLLDWKSNYLGPSDADYTQEKMEAAMQSHDYFLQASIYADALSRYVKLFDSRPFSESFGGAVYYFVRGSAVYHFIPDIAWRSP